MLFLKIALGAGFSIGGYLGYKIGRLMPKKKKSNKIANVFTKMRQKVNSLQRNQEEKKD